MLVKTGFAPSLAWLWQIHTGWKKTSDEGGENEYYGYEDVGGDNLKYGLVIQLVIQILLFFVTKIAVFLT